MFPFFNVVLFYIQEILLYETYIPLAGNIFYPNMYLSSIQNDISLFWIAENVELAAILDLLLEFFRIYSKEFLERLG